MYSKIVVTALFTAEYTKMYSKLYTKCIQNVFENRSHSTFHGGGGAAIWRYRPGLVPPGSNCVYPGCTTQRQQLEPYSVNAVRE